MTSAKNVDMEMGDGLATIIAAIYDHAIAVAEPCFARDMRGLSEQVSQKRCVRFLNVRGGGYMQFGND